jgi:hypothetical protein
MIENTLWKILAIILAVILLFIVPLESMFRRQDDISYSIVYTEANKFIDMSRDVGCISGKRYNDFVDKINNTGNLYKVNLEHYHKKYVPIYDDSDTTYLNKYVIKYEGTYTKDILNKLFEEGQYKMNTGDLVYIDVKNTSKTKASILRDIIYNNSSKYPSIYVRGGGMVKDETN